MLAFNACGRGGRLTAIVVSAGVAFAALAARTPDQPAPALITIGLEKQVGDRAQPAAQNTVFTTGDVLRFRLSSELAGYLYVVDRGTSGTVATLFPGSAGDNHVVPKRPFLVPADGDGWFQVSGPPGFDVLYFVVSDGPMTLPPAAAPLPQSAPGREKPPAPALPPELLPRCNDEAFKSRGECFDDSAGPAPLARDAVIPREIMPLAGSASRDIVLSEDGDQTTIRPALNVKLPVIYTFRLAHH